MMAPLYKMGFFGLETGLIVALFIGLGFGFFLERAGLGNARKLAAQFYLTDLTVFKVMFTAIVTAMLGVFWLAWIGALDLGQIYLTPTYLVPQLVGGLVFGVGFVVGGYCPGTSCVAMSTGRLDAILLFLGMMSGVFAFAEAYEWLEGFYDSTYLGPVTLPELLEVPYGWLVALVVVGALAAFAVSEYIERMNGSRMIETDQ